MEQYRWETILETLPNYLAYFLVGNKKKRDKMLENIEKNFDGKIIHLNCSEDMLEQMKDVLYSDLEIEEKNRLESIFLNVPAHIAIDSCLENLEKPLLIIVDDVLPNNYMQIYASEYQMWIRANKGVYTIMCGTVKNVRKTMNMDGITFLWRAYRVYTDKESEERL